MGDFMIILDNNFEQFSLTLSEIFGKSLYEKRVIEECPHCSSNEIIKYGNYKNGQRYRCKNCGRTFSKRTNTSFYYSKKSPEMWARYIELMLKRQTLEECAKELGISVPTAFYWRHKILFTLSKTSEARELRNTVNMSKILIRENFKGNKNIEMIERNNVWTIIAIDSREEIIARPISVSMWNKISFQEKIYSKVDKKSFLNAYLDRYIWSIARIHNEGKIRDDKNFNTTILCKYIKEVRRAICDFRGVATKYLIHYLYWITIFVVGKEYKSLNLIYSIAGIDHYIKEKEIYNIQSI